MKRRPPIAKTLIKNSKAAMFAAIEVHNKPIFLYRYEIVVLLFINSWELLLKAYIYKFLKKVKLVDEDGKSKPFLDCLNCVVSNLDKKYKVLQENLERLYDFRNEIAHFHMEEMDIIIFSLLKRNLLLYKSFLEDHYNIDITAESNLILLPIGFKKLYSPLDFLSNESAIKNSSKYAKQFIGKILESTARLTNNGIEDSILIDFSMNLTNEKRIKNADIIAGISKEKNTGINIVIENIMKNPTVSDDVKETLGKSMSFNVAPRNDAEEIISWIALKGKDPNFLPSKRELWRIYSERDKLKIKKTILLEKIKFDFLRNVPVFYWIKDFNSSEIINIIEEILKATNKFMIKSNILHVSAFLGKTFYERLLKRFSPNEIKRLSPKARKFPLNGPRELFQHDIVLSKRRSMKPKSENEFRKSLIVELNQMTFRLGQGKGNTYDEYDSVSIDCYLYARDDKYRESRK